MLGSSAPPAFATSSTSATATSRSASTSGCPSGSPRRAVVAHRHPRADRSRGDVSATARRGCRPRCAHARAARGHGDRDRVPVVDARPHERRAAEIVGQELPDARVVCSHAVLPEIREWERTSAAILNVYLLDSIQDYLQTFERTGRTAACGAAADHAGERRLLATGDPPQARQYSAFGPGGGARGRRSSRPPPGSAMSSPSTWAARASTSAWSATGSRRCARRSGRGPADRCFRPSTAHGRRGRRFDRLARLRRCAPDRTAQRGAAPGPACYGAGGTEPTVTDANVVLGTLNPKPCWAAASLRRDPATGASRTRPSGSGCPSRTLPPGSCASPMPGWRTSIRAMTVERGHDPRQFTLLAFGGAGPAARGPDSRRQLGIARGDRAARGRHVLRLRDWSVTRRQGRGPRRAWRRADRAGSMLAIVRRAVRLSSTPYAPPSGARGGAASAVDQATVERSSISSIAVPARCTS